MTAKEENQFDRLLGDLIKEAAIEKTSAAFTSNLMQQIALEPVVGKVYKPLIAKSVWMIIAAAFLSLFGYVLLHSTAESNTLNTVFEAKWLYRLALKKWSSIQLSSIAMYAILLLAGMHAVQVGLLKYYFEKQFLRGQNNQR